MEVWKDIPGYKGIYQASSFGRIRSLDKTLWNGKGYYIKKGRILKFGTLPTGYKVCNLCNNGKTINRRVNRLVALSFIINPDNKPEVNHDDGNKCNNYYNNLKWCTHVENIRHAFKEGLMIRVIGETHHNAKLTIDDVIKIRELHTEGDCTIKTISKKFNVNVSTIYAIVNRETWKSV